MSVFFLKRVLFWPEISAYGVFINFDNERMRIAEHVIFVDRHVTNTLSDNWDSILWMKTRLNVHAYPKHV